MTSPARRVLAPAVSHPAEKNGKLDSWKQIADYLSRDVRTAIRWEKERGLPVHRIPGGKGHGVFALRHEVDAWLEGRPAAQKTIAVLPFRNESSGEEYLADGITEGLIGALSRFPELRILARSSVLGYKNKQLDPRKLAKELGVQCVVQGKLKLKGSLLSLSAEMVDATDGTLLWTEHYDRKCADLFSVQQRMAVGILQRLGLRAEAARNRGPSPDLEAYQHLLRGRHFLNLWTAESVLQAVECHQHAIQVDPAYARAYAGLAECYAFMALGYGDLPPREFLEKSYAAASKALELDDQLAEAHLALGLCVYFIGEWDWAASGRAFRRAIQLNPSLSQARIFYAYLMVGLGHPEDALEMARTANALDPVSGIASADVAAVLCCLQRYDEALAVLEKWLELNPQAKHGGQWVQGWAYGEKGMYDEAIACLRSSLAGSITHTTPLGVLAYYLARAGQGDEARKVVAQIEDLSRQRHITSATKAIAYAGLGDTEAVLNNLEEAYKQHSAFLFFMQTWPWFRPFRAEPRFQSLLGKLGLAPSVRELERDAARA